ncbi:MAG: hypothetical protein ACE5I7_02390 [Candidatus Binatia bacterium]
MKAREFLALGMLVATGSLIGCTPRGLVAGFYRAECPRGWAEADGSHHKLNLEGRTIVGVGPWPQGGGEISLGESGGSHKMRVSVLENQNARKRGDNSIEGVRVEWEDEGKTEARGTKEDLLWRQGPWLDHFPPYVGLLYCVKR